MLAFAGLLAYAGVAFVLGRGRRRSADRRIVVDWHTGSRSTATTRSPFSPTASRCRAVADLELRYGGAVWRFSNVGNRAAFAATPNVYMPQYGGYDPVGVARGVAVAGNPNVWLITGQRLFLFYDSARRAEIRRRSGSRDRLGRPQMAGRAAHAHAVTLTAPRSPQAMKPGNRSSACHRRAASRPVQSRCRRPPRGSRGRPRCPNRGSAPAADKGRRRLRRAGRISPTSRIATSFAVRKAVDESPACAPQDASG